MGRQRHLTSEGSRVRGRIKKPWEAGLPRLSRLPSSESGAQNSVGDRTLPTSNGESSCYVVACGLCPSRCFSRV